MIDGVTFRNRLRRVGDKARRPELLAFLPAITLAALWLGGDEMLMIVALGLPALFGIAGVFSGPEPERKIVAIDGVTGLPLRDTAVFALDDVLDAARTSGRSTCCFVLTLDDADQIAERHGTTALAQILRQTGDRLKPILRTVDTISRLEGPCFAIVLGGVRRVDLEGMLQLATRLQAAADASVSIDANTVYLSSSVGFCLESRAPQLTGMSMLGAAESAATEARRNGPGAIRSYTVEMQRSQSTRHSLRSEIDAALSDGQIIAHFQPQISTDTGEVTGFEALARWQHPERGLLPPGEFLEALRNAGLSERLSEVMIHHSLMALREWDRLAMKVPCVAVNFCSDELRNPRLAEKLKWEMDRYDLAAPRLTVEILETVVADLANDVIVRNIAALAEMGCGIDLDDFGTGHASIANIRRFAVSRIKIDRSFVTRVDEDREQQKMIAAILSMAERLGLETLAEGVETLGEHAMLGQLGCGHVQGFSIGRPMALEETIPWVQRHQQRLAAAPGMIKRFSGI